MFHELFYKFRLNGLLYLLVMEVEELQKLLHAVFLRSPVNLFDEFLSEVQKWYELPAHTLTEMRVRNNKKIRGDIFEEFCVLYLKFIKNYEIVWLLCDVPEDVLLELKMKRQDMGIDIIVKSGTDYYAVQCKYKKRGNKTANILSWTALSTFYAMCLRTGPWEKYIVMTNCDYTRHQGGKTSKDLSICLKSFQNLQKSDWIKLCNLAGSTLENFPNEENSVNLRISKPSVELTKEELRALRLAYYGKNIIV